MSEIILKAESVSKQYRLGLVGTGTISHDLNRWWHKIRGKEDPYLKIGEKNDRSSKGNSDYVWALNDITFEVNKGDVLGIIGKNGAGKSTLLKILSKVTGPTTGEIKTKGRIASLLEVGTGFHGEMTGRENIFLNGAILGMTKNEIASKIEEIIEFSGCQRYIDTPVKRYSSGMTVRLAFAVAAFLEPEILVIDEVLAVGDAEFQKKAIGKMQDISKGEGRTVIFVSHNMAAVKNLCTKGIVLEHGSVVFTGNQNEAVDYYLSNSVSNIPLDDRKDRVGNKHILVTAISFFNNKGDSISQAISGEYLKIRLHISKNKKVDYSKLFVGIAFVDNQENKAVSFLSDEMGSDFSYVEHNNFIDLIIPELLLRSSVYNLTFMLTEGSTRTTDALDILENATDITILQGDYWNTGKTNRAGKFALIPATYDQSI